MFNYSFTRTSSNTKTGPIPTTMTNRASCPSACPLASNGCYADLGPVGIHWRKLEGEGSGKTIEELVSLIKALPKGQLWRMNVAGDLAHDNQVIDAYALGALCIANKGRKGFTYTHHRVTGQDDTAKLNRASIAGANSLGFTVNLSANNAEHADELVSLNIGPVVVLMQEGQDKVSYTPAGNTIVQCPATYREDINCSSCGICAVSTRKAIIGFPVHGARRRKAAEVMEGFSLHGVRKKAAANVIRVFKQGESIDA